MRAESKRHLSAACLLIMLAFATHARGAAQDRSSVTLPNGASAVWDLEKAHAEATDTRERICINGLWQWQPAAASPDAVPIDNWGFFKVPGCWPGITDYMQKDCQTVFRHPSWNDTRLGNISAAWYQREIIVPKNWTGRRIALQTKYLNSFATVYIDGDKAGELRFPAGELDLTAACRPGQTHVLSMLVLAMPLKAVMLSYSDTSSAREVKGRVARRGLCGDVYLASLPIGPRITDVKINTSVRKGRIGFDVALEGLAKGASYRLQATLTDKQTTVQRVTSEPFQREQLTNGRMTFTHQWQPEKLWNVNTPQHMYQAQLSLARQAGDRPENTLSSGSRPKAAGDRRPQSGRFQHGDAPTKREEHVCDISYRVRFGFREFWIDGRDFFLNGNRIFLSSVPLDNAQVGAAWANYDAARESMQRLQQLGVNFVYTHNYGCQPGSHLSFKEILAAADDIGMLVAFSQPHFGHYDWSQADADETNGYAQHASFYVRVAQNHPSVVAYSTSHNATGYAEDMNPYMIDGVQDQRSEWSATNVERARRVERIIKQLDPNRILYHHASGNLGAMHTSNFYANFAPIQEMSDWFEHWATHGVKPLFTCEYSVPMPWDWTMYRGWYKGRREFGSAKVPWEFCLAEWNAQFLGDEAYKISDQERENLRWEAKQFDAGKTWHRWDYPHVVGSADIPQRDRVYAMYFADNWPAFRTWGVSANSPWNHGHYWTLREGIEKSRKDLPVDWETLQRPGYSPDYIEDRYERIDLAYRRSDWKPTLAARALLRNNGKLLAYIAGSPNAFTSKDHNYFAGEQLKKQLIVINNSRNPVTGTCQWSLDLPTQVTGTKKITAPVGQQHRIPLILDLPKSLNAGSYRLRTSVTFDTGTTQKDSFSIDVLPRSTVRPGPAKIAVFDPPGQTSRLLKRLAVPFETIKTEIDTKRYDMLVIGKNALTIDGPAPNIEAVNDGLKVLLFEQTPDVLERRLGFRVATYGLRKVFQRVSDHPMLAGLGRHHLRNWRGEATLVPPRLDYRLSPEFNYTPTVRWCGIPVPRLWRCGNRGNVATALIEKPHRGNFLPVLDGGYALQYTPLVEYCEGAGMVLFCQLDVTDRTENDPAADILVQNMMKYISEWRPTPQRQVVYVGDPMAKRHLDSIGVTSRNYHDTKLDRNTLLVVGPGGGRDLGSNAEAIARWLGEGGHLLALGLDASEANAFLPVKIQMKEDEHIATYFEPFATNSPLAGIAPADVHNPAPRQLPLLTGEPAIGNGVLGQLEQQHVIFLQLPPFDVEYRPEQRNLKRTYRRTSFLLSRLLANLGAAGTTPLLERFSVPLSEIDGDSLVKNGEFSVGTDPMASPDQWIFSAGSKAARCSRERLETDTEAWSVSLTCPPSDDDEKSSTMLAQHDIPVVKDQWYRISLRAKAKDFTAKSVALTITNMATWRSFFDYQRFQPGNEWETFSFEVQSNDTAEDKTRLQIWYSGAGTLSLTDVRIVPIKDPLDGRWLEGLYLDRPEAWDDPYRFFRW